MSPVATRRRRKSARLIWAWDFGPALNGNDVARLLQLFVALQEVPALGHAAQATGISYRAAWGLLRRCEAALGAPLVIMERGRGSRLTELGEEMLQIDSATRLALASAQEPWQRRMNRLLEPLSAPPQHLRLIASNDLALADWFDRAKGLDLDLQWRGSEAALAALGRDECDIAGFHLPELWTPAQAAGWLGRWLRPRTHTILPLMRRCQGLIVAAGNPHRVVSLVDVSRLKLNLVNRQRGSGTRNLFDDLIAANGLRPERIHGYRHEEFTHEAVAATIASGQADVGFGIAAAAARYGLDFVPLVWERYGLAWMPGIVGSAAGQRLMRALQGAAWRRRLGSTPGYGVLPARPPGAWEDFLA